MPSQRRLIRLNSLLMAAAKAYLEEMTEVSEAISENPFTPLTIRRTAQD
jgi:hypothetical protein